MDYGGASRYESLQCSRVAQVTRDEGDIRAVQVARFFGGGNFFQGRLRDAFLFTESG